MTLVVSRGSEEIGININKAMCSYFSKVTQDKMGKDSDYDNFD